MSETTESLDDIYDIPNLYNDSNLQTDSRLILCIEEFEIANKTNSMDNRIFIGWNREDNDYYLRGKRMDTAIRQFVPYAFHCDTTDALCDFIKFAIGPRKSTSVVLYNYNNIYPMCPTSELTYEFFEENIDRNYEIAAYDNIKLNRNYLKNVLRILKNMYNYENYENDDTIN